MQILTPREEEDRREEARRGWFFFLCLSNTKKSHVFIAIEGLRKNRKAAAVTATVMMEAEDQAGDQQN